MEKESILVNGTKDNVPRAIRATYGKTKTAAALCDYNSKPTLVMEKEKQMCQGWRIRKLTARECFRLMDMDDADIDKIQAAGIPKTQQYKIAGNSIVVSCLYHLFRKMFIEQGNENQQLELF